MNATDDSRYFRVKVSQIIFDIVSKYNYPVLFFNAFDIFHAKVLSYSLCCIRSIFDVLTLR